jgi:protein kinase-like protein
MESRDRNAVVEGIVSRLAALDEDDRSQQLESLCRSDPALHGEVLRSLDASGTPGQPEEVTAETADPDATIPDSSPPGASGMRAGEVGWAPPPIEGLVLMHELGRGGMGSVWLARDELLDRLVTVKFVLPEVVGSIDEVLKGAKVAARVEHPGLARIYHADVVEGTPYLVKEYVSGESLSGVIRSRGRLTPEQAVVVVHAVAEAVGELHRQGLVHRDIKPGNILLEESGRVVVTDFGLSCERPYATLGGVIEHVAGTPAYMAPELFQGEVSARTDVYALGITLFELLAGEPPFRGSVATLKAAHAAEELPLDRIEDLPEDLRRVLECATSKQALYRYKTADHFARALPRDDKSATGSAAVVMSLLTRDAERETVEADQTPAAEGDTTQRLRDAMPGLLARAMPKVVVDEPLTPVVSDIPESSLEQVDVPCLRCGYSLEGLPIKGTCPECGADIWTSICDPARCHFLFCDTEWIHQLRRGFTTLKMTFGLMILIIPTIMVFRFSVLVSVALSFLVPLLSMIIVDLAIAFAIVLVSRPDPCTGVKLGSRKVAKVSRVSIIILSTLLLVLALVVLNNSSSVSSWSAELSVVLILGAISFSLVAVVSSICRDIERRTVEHITTWWQREVEHITTWWQREVTTFVTKCMYWTAIVGVLLELAFYMVQAGFSTPYFTIAIFIVWVQAVRGFLWSQRAIKCFRHIKQVYS